jgi:hypothetical protein
MRSTVQISTALTPLIALTALSAYRPVSVSGTPSRTVRQAQSIVVAGAVEKPGAWSVERFEHDLGGDVKTISYILKTEKRTSRCVPLLGLIRASQPRIDAKQKNHPLAFAVIVRARDGYAACFSMGELSEEGAGRAVWIALNQDGKPLPNADGPVRLVIPDDAKPARWVHAVSTITIVDGLKEAGK